jgi:Ca2+-binding EF-hand superfamily protein
MEENNSIQVHSLTDERMQEYYTVFKMYQRDGTLPFDQFGAAWRSLIGQAPPEHLLELLLQALPPAFRLNNPSAGGPAIDFPTFVQLLEEHRLPEDPELERKLIEAFEIFDEAGSGLILTKDFHRIMRALGEPTHSEEELLDLVQSASAHGPMVNYRIATKLFLSS